jgi:hypothetical protein
LKQYEDFLGLNKKNSKELNLMAKDKANASIEIPQKVVRGKIRL